VGTRAANYIEPELQQFQSIIGERTAARLELDRVLIRGHVPERYQAVRAYVDALVKRIVELEAWSAALRGLLDRAHQAEAIPAEDSFWALLRATGVGSWITSLRQERNMLAAELAAIDALNAAPRERDETSNGTAPG
jgi:hypothetical protein